MTQEHTAILIGPNCGRIKTVAYLQYEKGINNPERQIKFEIMYRPEMYY